MAMLSTERDDHRRVFRCLGFVDTDSVGKRHFVKFTELLFHYLDLEVDVHHTLFEVDLLDATNLAVEDLLVIVVDGLQDQPARAAL